MRSFKSFLAPVLVAFGLIAAVPAGAVTLTSTSPNPTLTVGNYNFTVYACTFSFAGATGASIGSQASTATASSGSCPVGGLQLTASGNGGVSITGSPSVLASTASAAAADLTVSIAISTVDGSASITHFLDTISGSGGASAGGALKNAGNVNIGLLSSSTASPTQYFSFAGQNVVYISNLDLHAGGVGQTLTSITFDVPEPATAALILAGLSAIGAVRRRRAA